MVNYEDKSTLGRGSYIEVIRALRPPQLGKPVLAAIGWIGRTPDGEFAYYEPLTNELNPKFIEGTLDKLKRKIETLYKAEGFPESSTGR